MPFELRDGNLLVHSTLRSPSGRDTSGLLIVDTGAPDLALTRGVWTWLRLDSVAVLTISRRALIRRPLDALEIGSARFQGLEVRGVLADSLFHGGILGLLGLSILENRGVVVDYEHRQLAIVNRSMTPVGRDTSRAPQGTNLGSRARVWRSRSRFADILTPGAVAVPFRMFPGGRMLIAARIEDPSRDWRSEPLTMLLDTGASGCMLFDDAVESSVRRLPLWPRLDGVRFRTVLGDTRGAATVLPRLVLTEASPPLAESNVEAGTQDRRSLPDIEGELPERMHGLIGATFLARFRLVLDYTDEVLWLEPVARQARSSSGRAQVGLALERRWNELRVAGVARGSPAAESGVRFGEIVVSIDGAPVAGLEAQAAERRLEGKAGSPVVLIVRAGGMERVLRLTRR